MGVEHHSATSGGAPLLAGGVSPRVLVTDRRRAFAEALAGLLAGTGLDATFAPYDEAEEACRVQQPRRLLLDGDPPLDGAAVVAEAARAAADDVRIILLVGGTGRGRGRALANIGADAVLSRQCGLGEVLSVIRGEPGASPASRAAAGPYAGTDRNPLDRLTPRERQVLRALMAGGRSAAIAEALGISPHTVRTHVQNTFAKLAVSTRLEAASIARSAGLRPLSLDEAAAGRVR